jgi:hypothetical protein
VLENLECHNNNRVEEIYFSLFLFCSPTNNFETYKSLTINEKGEFDWLTGRKKTIIIAFS